MDRIILLLGPTAVGKTALAMQLFDALGGQSGARLISVDSALVYRTMDIGSAKPSSAELAAYPHALIDIRDPADPYTVADFVRDADREVSDALAFGQTPILVGGTMLYAKRFVEGIAEVPASDTLLRAALQSELETRGAEALYAELKAADPDAARDIYRNNPQRLLRALEVVRATGEPLTQLWRSKPGRPAHARFSGLGDEMRIEIVGLVPDDRRKLHRAIEDRFIKMLELGLLDEVKALMTRGDLHPDLPAMRAVGYRQAWQHLAGETEYPQFVADATTATRRLAKRQLTWLRQWADVKTVTQSQADDAFVELVSGRS